MSDGSSVFLPPNNPDRDSIRYTPRIMSRIGKIRLLNEEKSNSKKEPKMTKSTKPTFITPQPDRF